MKKYSDLCKKYKNLHKIFKGKVPQEFLTANIVNSQLCKSGCSKQAWLNKGKVPRNPAH
jgi:hypothetical protein